MGPDPAEATGCCEGPSGTPRNLRDRLRALRAGPRSDPVAGDLVQRIQRLRARGGARPADGPLDEAALARRLGARAMAPGLWCLEGGIPLGTHHGRVALALPDPVAAGFPEFTGTGAGDWLFLDTETTGLSGGSGTLVFLLGVARFRAGVLHLRQYLITRFAAEEAMLRALAADLRGGEALVSYNGKSFDLPLLAARFRLHAFEDPLAGLAHLDLLHPVRRRFGTDWENCRLATLERRLLGFERTADLPGSEAPRAWLDFVRLGRGQRLPAVVRHNRLDLLSLAAAFPALARPERKTVPTAGATGTRGGVPGRERLRALRLALASTSPFPIAGSPGR